MQQHGKKGSAADHSINPNPVANLFADGSSQADYTINTLGERGLHFVDTSPSKSQAQSLLQKVNYCKNRMVEKAMNLKHEDIFG